MKDAKDPDEFVIKYGNVRFNNLVEEAISLVEFKVKMLKSNLNLENTNDKIKFLNEIAKILSQVNNQMEQEIYIEKIAKDYNISKEAIYAETNKLNYSKNSGSKILESNQSRKIVRKTEEVPENIAEREELVISLLINETDKTYEKIREKIASKDFKDQINKEIIQKLYEEFEKGNININGVLDFFSEELEIISRLTKIMANDYELSDIEKATNDVINIYEKERLIEQRNNIIEKLSDKTADEQSTIKLEKQLQDIILRLTQIK